MALGAHAEYNYVECHFYTVPQIGWNVIKPFKVVTYECV